MSYPTQRETLEDDGSEMAELWNYLAKGGWLVKNIGALTETVERRKVVTGWEIEVVSNRIPLGHPL